MAKVKYDVSGATAGGDWEHVKPGLYQAKVESMEHKDSQAGNPMFEIRFRPVAEADGSKLSGEFSSIFYHVLTDGSMDSRLRALTDALALKPKGTIDTDKETGKTVLIQAKSDKDQDGEYRPRIAKVMPLPDDAADLDEEEESEESEEEDAEDEGVDLDELDRNALKALIKDHELDIRVTKSKTDDQLREEIAAAFSESEEDEEEDEDAEENEDEEELDLDSLSRNELKAFIKDQELEIRVLKSMSDDDIRAAIQEALEGESEEEDDDEEEDSSNGYTEMSIQQLKDALKERGLNTSGAKKVLVARLEEDDTKGGDPF